MKKKDIKIPANLLTNMRVGLVDSILCELHCQEPNHPEAPQRVQAIREALAKAKFPLIPITPHAASDVELHTVHLENYVKHVKQTCKTGGFVSADPDVFVQNGSLTSALIAAGGVIDGVRAVVDGTCDHVFCNVRPPSHHACAHKGSGFCVFNNTALGVMEALKTYNRVLLFDWDSHHFNGSAAIFKHHPQVLLTSFHVAPPFYPNSGHVSENTASCLNYPLAPKTSAEEYRKLFEFDYLPKARAFNPDVIFISCGFDSHVLDSIGQLMLTEPDYAWMTFKLKEFGKPIIVSLEGGYNISAVASSAVAVVSQILAV